MFALQAITQRHGAICKEYFNPDVKEPIPGIVFANLLKKSPAECGAKTYETEDEAAAGIDIWAQMTQAWYDSRDEEYHDALFRACITVVPA